MNRTFVVSGLASPQLPLRLLGLFAQRDLLPLSLNMRRSSAGVILCIVQDKLDDRSAAVILEKMRAIPDMKSASLTG